MSSLILVKKFGVSGSFPAGSGTYPIYDKDAPDAFRLSRFDRSTFGSDTTTITLEAFPENRFIMIDQGSATRRAARSILRRISFEQIANPVVDIWCTHGHDDHWLGCAGNELLLANVTIRYWSPELVDEREEAPGKPSKFQRGVPIAEIMLRDYINSDTWSTAVAKMLEQGAARREHRIFTPGETTDVDGAYRVETIPLVHDGGCAGLKFLFPGVGAVAICTDYEPGLDPYPERVAAFVNGACYAYLDLQYRFSEWRGDTAIGDGPAMCRKGWGHGTEVDLANMLLSTRSSGIEIAECGHHDPDRDDDDLLKFERQTQKLFREWKVPCQSLSFARPSRVIELRS
jgi:glyoxylase-like metal-dependent hydrolase (beta-lactamase superfamily II)